MTLTQINSKGIKDGEILDADINASAAIDGSKLNPVGLSNVGIGTTSPSTGLEITSGMNSDGLSILKGSNSSVFLGHNGSGDEGLLQLKDGGTTTLQIYGETGQPSFFNAGNVGIGTTSPDTLLHLAGADTAVIRLENTDASLGLSQLIGAIEFEKQDPTGAGAGIAGAIRLKSMSSVGQAASMFFATSNSSANDADRMIIDYDGRVLIGGATSINASTNADDLQVGASSQSNQTGITLGSTVASSLRFMDAANDSAGYILMNHNSDELTIKSNSGGIIFNVSGQVATMDSTGLKLVSGKGINFHDYATSGNPSSNLLDDYEEGTFTPTLGWSLTPTTANGRYTKIGRMVYYTLQMVWPSTTNLNYVLIGSLPFDAMDGDNAGGAFIRYTNYSSGGDIKWHQNNNQSLTAYHVNGSTITNSVLSTLRMDLVGFYIAS